MCGITGVFSHSTSPRVHERFVRWSMKQMQRRGPDSEGYLAIGNVAFGFRRLAIRDTHERANQPMYSERDGCVLIYNGELYNTEFLKSQLPLNIRFTTSSDTEVLFFCLIHLGPEKTIPLLDGIFAFAFYNANQDKLIVARDRCGIKPIYYGINNGILIFCSEYSHILCHEAFAGATANADAIGQYLQLGFMPDGECIFHNTFLLPHGHYLSISKGEAPVVRDYYNYQWQTNRGSLSYLNEVIEESVIEQLVSDVPIGVFQSGGIDSSLVCNYAQKANKNLESFTIGVTGAPGIDESEHARSFAEILGIKNNLKHIDADIFLSLIIQNFEAFSEPFADFSSLPTLLLSQFARTKVTVALSGDGGDELFWGYPRNIHTATILSGLKGSPLARFFSLLRNRTGISGNKKMPWKVLRYDSMADYAYSRTFISGAHEWLGKIFSHHPSIPFFLRQLQNEIELTDQLSDVELMNILRKVEFDFHLQRVLLKVDRASLYHSLEVRVPILSNRMLEASLHYNYMDCVKGEIGKLPLRKALENYSGTSLSLLPKKGFTIPMNDWINGVLTYQVNERLTNIPSVFAPFFNKNNMEAFIASRQNPGTAWLTWALYALFEWSDNTLRKHKADYASFQI